MSLSVTLAVLLAALLHASWNAMIKGGRDVLLETALIVAGAGIVMLPLVALVPLPAPASWPFLFASLVSHVAYYALMVSAYRSGDLSLVYPLMRGAAPLLTAVFGVLWLAETPGSTGWIGIALISCGVAALAARGLDHAPSRAAIGFALSNAVVIAAYTVIDGTGARRSGNPWSYIVWLFVLDAIPFTLWMLATRRQQYLAALANAPARTLAGGGLSAAAYAISVWAMTQAPIALVASLRETSVLFAALIGARMLREKLGARRWLAAAAIVAGAVFLKLD